MKTSDDSALRVNTSAGSAARRTSGPRGGNDFAEAGRKSPECASELTVGWHPPELGCPFVESVRRRSVLVDRNCGYAPQAIVLGSRADLAEASVDWLAALLGFDTRRQCWAVYGAVGAGGALEAVSGNPTFNDPQQLAAAQRWMASQMQASDEQEHDRQDDAARRLTAPKVVPAVVTEWRAVFYAGRAFYAPLFNISPVCWLPVRDVLPETGADCGCLSVRQRVAGHG